MISVITMQIRTKQWKPFSATTITCRVLIFTHKTMEALISYDYLSGTHFYAQNNGSPYQLQRLFVGYSFLRTKQWKPLSATTIICRVLIFTHKTMEALISYDYLSGTHFTHKTMEALISYDYLSGTHFYAQKMEALISYNDYLSGTNFYAQTMEALTSYDYLSGTHFYAQNNGSPYQLRLLVRYSIMQFFYLLSPFNKHSSTHRTNTIYIQLVRITEPCVT